MGVSGIGLWVSLGDGVWVFAVGTFNRCGGICRVDVGVLRYYVGVGLILCGCSETMCRSWNSIH